MALELGPCQVMFGATGSEVDLGKTHGGVTVRFTDDYQDLMSDQFGTAPEDTIITGNSAEVEANFAEIDFDLLAQILNQSVFGTSAGVTGENNVGTSLLANAKNLILKKYTDGAVSTDAADWITFPKAAPRTDAELSYDSENQRVMRTIFSCFYSTVNANWGAASASDKTVLYYFGDESATS